MNIIVTYFSDWYDEFVVAVVVVVAEQDTSLSECLSGVQMGSAKRFW